MSAEFAQYGDRSAESRDDLLQVPSLWEYLCERTSADARSWFSSKSSPPPWSTIIACVLLSVIFLAWGSALAFVFIGLVLAQVVWLIFVKSTNSKYSLDKVLRDINSGVFPQELREYIVKRLRWWNSLLVPMEWTHNSRIYDVRERLILRVEELGQEVQYWQSAQGISKREERSKQEAVADERRREQQQKLKLLQSRGVNVTGLDEDSAAEVKTQRRESYSDPEMLAKLIRNSEQRDAHLARIRALGDPLERALEERVFIAAILSKAEKITALLDQIEQLQPHIETIKADNLDSSVKNIIGILEQRRTRVIPVIQISPKRVMPLFTFDFGTSEREL